MKEIFKKQIVRLWLEDYNTMEELKSLAKYIILRYNKKIVSRYVEPLLASCYTGVENG